MAQKTDDEQQREWGEQAREKSLKNLSRAEEELNGLRRAIERNEPISLGRTKLLAHLLDGLKEVDGAW
jgi:hypothetical protein